MHGTGSTDSTHLHERTRWVFEHLPAWSPRLLDAGCHDGSSTAIYASRAGHAVGIDLDLDAVVRGHRTGVPVHLVGATSAALPFEDSTFDCVVFSEVLEHVPPDQEQACIRELRRVLRPGGLLLLTTPHRGRFWWLDPLMFKTHVRRLLRAVRGQAPHLKGHKHYRLGELRLLLAPAFDIEVIERPGEVLYPIAYWGHLLPLGIGRLPPLARLWQRMMDYDYRRECGDAAYNICLVARARATGRG